MLKRKCLEEGERISSHDPFRLHELLLVGAVLVFFVDVGYCVMVVLGQWSGVV